MTTTTTATLTYHDILPYLTPRSRFEDFVSWALDNPAHVDRVPRHAGRSAVTTSDGFLIGDFVSRDGEYHSGAFWGSRGEYARNIEAFAEHLLRMGKEADAVAALRQQLLATLGADPQKQYPNGLWLV